MWLRRADSCNTSKRSIYCPFVQTRCQVYFLEPGSLYGFFGTHPTVDFKNLEHGAGGPFKNTIGDMAILEHGCR